MEFSKRCLEAGRGESTPRKRKAPGQGAYSKRIKTRKQNYSTRNKKAEGRGKPRKQFAFGYPPKGLLEHFQRNLPNFKILPWHQQTGVISLLWANIGTKRYSHAIYDDHFTVYCRLLDNVFGRCEFKPMNKRLGLFEVIESWSIEHGLTKAYRPTDEAYRLLNGYLQSKIQREHLIGDNGKIMRNNGEAILSRDTNGNKAKRSGKLSMAVPTNAQALTEGAEVLRKIKDGEGVVPESEYEEYLCRAALPIPQDEIEQWCQRRMDCAYGFLKLTASNITFKLPGAQIPQRYAEVQSGRLYGYGLNLQNAPREIKALALYGCHEYDFENCHYSLLVQLAKRHGVETPYLTQYLARKKKVRAELALNVGITKDQVKTCLIALIYGAKFSQDAKDAIPAEIGEEAAQRLYSNEVFKGMAKDVVEARKAIVSHLREYKQDMKGVKKGFITNAMGKTIKRDEKPKHIMAHILQGIEAKMINVAIDLFGNEIMLLQHDGFTTIRPIDRVNLQAEIKQQTGYEIAVSEAILPAD